MKSRSAVLLICTLAVLGSLAEKACAGITVTRAEIANGRLMVAGTRSGNAPRILLDGRFSADVGGKGNFSFALIYLPSDCIVKLEADGGTGGEEMAVIANCAPRSLRPRGAWRTGANYAENDLVTDDGSTYRAKAANAAKRPALNDQVWEAFAVHGERGAQGIQGATGVRGNDGTPGRDGAVPLLLHGGQANAVITNAFGFIGPTGDITVAKDQIIVIEKAAIALRLTNGAADTTADITFCSRADDGAEAVPFAKIAESITLALPHGSPVDYSQDFDMMAADPGHPGLFTVGACMRHAGAAATSLTVDDFRVSKALVTASR